MRHAVAAEAAAEKEAEEDAAEAIRTGRDPAGPAPKAGSAAALRATYKKGPKGAQRAAPVDDLALESKREEAPRHPAARLENSAARRGVRRSTSVKAFSRDTVSETSCDS